MPPFSALRRDLQIAATSGRDMGFKGSSLFCVIAIGPSTRIVRDSPQKVSRLSPEAHRPSGKCHWIRRGFRSNWIGAPNHFTQCQPCTGQIGFCRPRRHERLRRLFLCVLSAQCAGFCWRWYFVWFRRRPLPVSSSASVLLRRFCPFTFSRIVQNLA